MKPEACKQFRQGTVRATCFVLTLIILAGLTFSCKKKKAGPECSQLEGGLLEVCERTAYDAGDVMNNLKLLPDDPQGFDYHDFFTETMAQIPNSTGLKLIWHEKVKYWSTDNLGNPVQLTGLLIYPYNLQPFGKVTAPIVSVDHGTQLQKKFAPSKWKKASWSDWKDFPEMLIADIMAVWYGWIIIMPDYQGMGDDVTENHPYCIKDRLATATADMVEAAQRTFSCERNEYCRWNGKTFLYGFSEGGYVTMVAARELEQRKVDLAGVVCLDGPYDLSGTMLNVMLRDSAFPVPYFLPMLMVGYHTIYPDAYEYQLMLKEPYRTDIPKYTTGFYDEDKVNSIMPPDKILKEVFTDPFTDSLKSVGSEAFGILYDNNAFIHWTPKSHMLLWHCKNDDCVPFGNYVTAKNRFTSLGLTQIDYVEWPPVELNPDRKTIHVTVAPRAFYEGSRWIYHHSR